MNGKATRRLTAFLLAFCMTGCTVCFAQALTKAERLKNTIYLQHMNYSTAKDGVMQVVDKEDKTVTPRIKDDVFYVPLRYVLESYGVNVSWDDAVKSVVVTAGTKKVLLSVNDDELTSGELREKLEYDCYIDNGRTYAALDDVKKIIKCHTYYYSENKAAVIAVGEEWLPEREAEIQAHSAMEFAISPFFKMFT